jgi:hypothetical protein
METCIASSKSLYEAVAIAVAQFRDDEVSLKSGSHDRIDGLRLSEPDRNPIQESTAMRAAVSEGRSRWHCPAERLPKLLEGNAAYRRVFALWVS